MWVRELPTLRDHVRLTAVSTASWVYVISGKYAELGDPLNCPQL
jgi:hypothetical protein